MNENAVEKSTKKGIKIRKFFLTLIFIVFIVLLVDVLLWAEKVFGRVPFAQVVYHMKAPLEGTDSHILNDYFSRVIMDLIIVGGCIYILFLPDIFRFCLSKVRKINYKKDSYQKDNSNGKIRNVLTRVVSLVEKIRRYLIDKMLLFSAISLLVVFIVDVYWFGVLTWIKNQIQSSSIYEEYYVDSADVEIIAPKDKKNLILIVSESLEATYCKIEDGGSVSYDLMPNLTQLAKENTHFSQANNMRGAVQVSGTEWTIAGIVAYTSGIPLAIPISQENMDRNESFLPGVTSLGEILEKNGYRNELIIGSDKEFSGKDLYFMQHGNYQIYDIDSAIADDYVQSANDFWGLDDAMLFQIAKDRILEASSQSQPFHFLMETVDLHSPFGYRCERCPSYYRNSIGGGLGIYLDAICCQDAQINEFINWCKEQEFYEDTVIVIIGDHTSMASIVRDKISSEDYERTTFHVIINGDIEPTYSENRLFTPMDMFPTILASMEFQIEGNRLGIGTNLYSGEKTVMEEMGKASFMEEISKNSRKYNKEILKKK